MHGMKSEVVALIPYNTIGLLLATLARNKRSNNWNNDLDFKTIEAAYKIIPRAWKIDETDDQKINRLTSIIDAQVFCNYRFHRLSFFIDYECQSISWWTNSNLKHLCMLQNAYMYMLGRVGYRDFVNANRWVTTTLVWLSIGNRLANVNRYQLTNKASIVIDWSIDFPIIGFFYCSSPEYQTKVGYESCYTTCTWMKRLSLMYVFIIFDQKFVY